MTNEQLKKGIQRDYELIAKYIELRVYCGYEIDSTIKYINTTRYESLNLEKIKRGITHFKKLKKEIDGCE